LIAVNDKAVGMLHAEATLPMKETPMKRRIFALGAAFALARRSCS
jgi:hypothetical protein